MAPADASFVNNYGPWALVTGASDGIGQGFARALARRGLNLVLVARRHGRLAALANELEQEHLVECRVLAVDLTRPEGYTDTIEAVTDLDVGLVVCAAGFGTSGPFLEGELNNELNMLQLNCGISAALSWELGPRLTLRGRGGLILLSSIVAFQGVPRSAHYAATKAYIQTLAEGLRLEWRDLGIDVLAVAPGPVSSGFAARAGMTMGKAEQPDRVAEESLRALGRTGMVRPGWRSKLLGYSLAMTPRRGRSRIMGMVMRGMTERRTA